jgi:hypothetical protein
VAEPAIARSLSVAIDRIVIAGAVPLSGVSETLFLPSSPMR